ncbi:MAG: MFS transporter [Dehalococcoidia bacterium]|nr:MFS transporter [Dehalococcoidia bacterium]
MAATTPVAGERRRFRLAGITRPVWVLGVVSFFADLSGEIVYPIIPLFITGTLGAPAVAVGIVEGVAEGTANLTKIVSGRWSDLAGARKPFVVAGYGLAAVGKLILGLAPAWGVALAGRAVDRFGKGMRTAPRDALLSDFTEPRYRGRAFGLHRTMDTLGAVGGPLLGLAFIALAGDHLREVILLALVPGVLAVVALRWLPERAPPRSAEGRHSRSAWRGLPGSFWLLLGISAVFMVGNSSDAFLILRSKDLGLSTTLVVLAYVVYNAVYAAISLPAGELSDRIPRAWLVSGGWAVFALVYLGFALAGDGWAAWHLFAVYGAYIALTDGVSKALVADMVPDAVRSGAMGLYQGLLGLAALVASVTAGILWDTVSERAPFYVGAGCAAAAAVALAGAAGARLVHAER